MKEINFYFKGHNFEYEARNTLRIFDSNIKYNILNKEAFKKYTGLKLVSILNETNEAIYGEAYLYLNDELLFSKEISRNEVILENDSNKKLRKTLIIKSMFSVLKSYYEVNPDYGILTGVRVVKIMLIARKNNKTDDEINKILKYTYEVSDEKIKLLWRILNVEQKYINEQNKQDYNLYIGIPFCPSKCSYCSFTSYVGVKDVKINNYLEALVYEIEETIKLALAKNLRLNTIYIGGGTPSVLSEEQINYIFNRIYKYYDASEINEITFEAGRVDTLTKEKLICLKQNKVNRISINPQTMNDKTLQIIGRNHTSMDIKNKFYLAREIGFELINMDMILGLPGENEEDVKNTIIEILNLRPENITVHALAYKRKSELSRTSKELTKDYDLIKKMHEVVNDKCNKESYLPYYMYRQKNIKGNSENIGFTLLEKECIYNIIIIEEIETILACGLGASSKIKSEDEKHVPLVNFKGIEEYILSIDEIIKKKKQLLKL